MVVDTTVSVRDMAVGVHRCDTDGDVDGDGFADELVDVVVNLLVVAKTTRVDTVDVVSSSSPRRRPRMSLLCSLGTAAAGSTRAARAKAAQRGATIWTESDG